MSLTLLVVFEAVADFQTATELADRVLIAAFDWLEPDGVEHQRRWVGEHKGDSLTWKRTKTLALEKGITFAGSFEGEEAEADAYAARRAIRLVRYLYPDLNGIMLVRDQDDQVTRRAGLEQARREERRQRAHQAGVAIDDLPHPLVIGLAIFERESWVIAGFDPLDDAETARLAQERQNLGFDPRHRSHELTACKDDRAKRSPKRVLKSLGGGNGDREQRCWQETALDMLKDRGASNGLASFLDEVRERFAPLIGHVAGSQIREPGG